MPAAMWTSQILWCEYENGDPERGRRLVVQRCRAMLRPSSRCLAMPAVHHPDAPSHALPRLALPAMFRPEGPASTEPLSRLRFVHRREDARQFFQIGIALPERGQLRPSALQNLLPDFLIRNSPLDAHVGPACGALDRDEGANRLGPVSYTHLTLPTIYSV